jgi:hypothetical protein
MNKKRTEIKKQMSDETNVKVRGERTITSVHVTPVKVNYNT